MLASRVVMSSWCLSSAVTWPETLHIHTQLSLSFRYSMYQSFSSHENMSAMNSTEEYAYLFFSRYWSLDPRPKSCLCAAYFSKLSFQLHQINRMLFRIVISADLHLNNIHIHCSVEDLSVETRARVGFLWYILQSILQYPTLLKIFTYV